MKFVVVNAFSLNMLDRAGVDLAVRPINEQGVRNLLNNEQWESAIGHADTAAVVSSVLGREVPANRVSAQFNPRETSLIVAQYTGPRLPEGATKLPEGAKIEFWQVYAT